MKHKLIKGALILSLLLIATVLLTSPTFAVESRHVTETVFFGNVEDDGSACGVYTILNLVIDILSIGIGILSFIGIAVVGIKYLTAKDNKEQTKKARHRLFQIIIGLAIYAVLYAGLQWLLPGGKLSTNNQCRTISDSELAVLREQEQQEREDRQEKIKEKTSNKKISDSNNSNNSSSSSNNSSSTEGDATCLKIAAKVVKEAGLCSENNAAERIAKTAELLAWPLGSPKKYHKEKGGRPTAAYKSALNEMISFPKSQRKYKYTRGISCSVFTSTVVRASGYDKKMPYSVTKTNKYAKKSSKWKLVSPSNAVRGDIFAYKNNNHILIYGGKKGTKYIWYQANLGRKSHNGDYGYTFYGKNPAKMKKMNVWHAVGK